MKFFFYLLTLFIITPVIELLLLLRIASHIGLLQAIVLIVLTGAIGAYLARRQGVRVIREIRTELTHGRLPGAEVLEGILILVAAAVLITPGLVTDIIGFLLLLPICRKSISLWLTHRIREKIQSKILTFHIKSKDGKSNDDNHGDNIIDIEADIIDDNHT